MRRRQRERESIGSKRACSDSLCAGCCCCCCGCGCCCLYIVVGAGGRGGSDTRPVPRDTPSTREVISKAETAIMQTPCCTVNANTEASSKVVNICEVKVK